MTVAGANASNDVARRRLSSRILLLPQPRMALLAPSVQKDVQQLIQRPHWSNSNDNRFHILAHIRLCKRPVSACYSLVALVAWPPESSFRARCYRAAVPCRVSSVDCRCPLQ